MESPHDSGIAPWDHEPGRVVRCSRFSVLGHWDTLKGGHRTVRFMESLQSQIGRALGP